MNAPLQWMQNTTARLVFELGKCEHMPAFFSSTGCQSAGKSSSSCADSCTPSFTEGVRTTIQHREACRPHPTIFFNNKLRDATAMDQIWRAHLFSCWPSHVERSTGGHACYFWFCGFQEATEDALFMAALCNRCGHYIFALFLFFLRLISAVADWMSTVLPHVMWP